MAKLGEGIWHKVGDRTFFFQPQNIHISQQIYEVFFPGNLP
jgi:hypothetical protein